ncbi:MAG TPA: hypothetical protein VK686_20750 [Bryobacteraceae bacterium]|nr:hypothetical protein [Bryobacteraceae bacterium]
MNLRLLRIFSVPFALTVCTSYMQAAALTAGTPTIALTCTVGQTCVSSNTSTLSIASGTGYFTVTAPTVPWLLVTPMAGTADTTPSDNVLTFSVSPGWTTLGAGLNTTTVSIVSLGNTSTSVTVTLQIQSATPTLLVKGGINTLNPIAFLSGSAAPVLTLTVLSSSGLPLAFTVTAASATTPEGVTNWLTSSSSSGIAYSWGTTLSFTASASATTQQAVPGDVLTGSITITPAGQTAVVIPVSISVSAAPATVTSVAPNTVPLLVTGVAPGFVTLVLHGTNFVSTTGTQKTKVFMGATLAAATQILTDYVTVLSPNYLTVTVPYAATGVPFATAGATALLVGVANGANPAAPVGATVTLAVTSAPIIANATSASSFVDFAAPRAAPYDIISIFGTNLCPLCNGSNSVLVGAPDAVYSRYPLFLSPDGSAATPHKITVIFSKPGTPATALPGYLLFATNNQLNVLVPGALATLANSGVNVQVAYDTVTPPAAGNTSAAFLLSNVATNPGIFTIASNGQGQGAITDASTFILNSVTAAATPFTATPATGIVAIFMTGLGVPNSVGTNVLTVSPVFGTNCLAALGVPGTSSVAPTGYMGTVNTPFFSSVTGTGYTPASGYVVPAWTSIDGAVMNATLLQGNFAPCFATSPPTVVIGGAPATVVSAGFVTGSIAGLYQINVQVPTPTALPTYAALTPQQYNVVVTIGGVASQAGVTMYID